MKTLQQQFDTLNKKYIALDKRQSEAARKNNEDLCNTLSLEMEYIQSKMSELANKMETK